VQTARRAAAIMDRMLTPRVTEVVRQGHAVTQPLRPREPFTPAPGSAPSSSHRAAPVAGG